MSAGKQSSRLEVGEFDGGQLGPLVRHSFLLTIRKSVPLVLEELRDEKLELFLIEKREPVAPPLRLIIPLLSELAHYGHTKRQEASERAALA